MPHINNIRKNKQIKKKFVFVANFNKFNQANKAGFRPVSRLL